MILKCILLSKREEEIIFWRIYRVVRKILSYLSSSETDQRYVNGLWLIQFHRFRLQVFDVYFEKRMKQIYRQKVLEICTCTHSNNVGAAQVRSQTMDSTVLSISVIHQYFMEFLVNCYEIFVCFKKLKNLNKPVFHYDKSENYLKFY